jgi:hypothetical protein
MRWARATACAGLVAASVVAIGLTAEAGAGGAPVAHPAATRTECCFVLTVRASGHISADFGQDYTTQGYVGNESYTWHWGTRELLEYSEYGGQPSLQRPVNRKFQPAPTLRQEGGWDAESNVAYVTDNTKMPPQKQCSQPLSHNAQLQDTLFVDVMRLRDTGPNVRTRFAGHTFVMRLLTDPRVYPFSAPCLETHSSVGELEAPPLSNGGEDVNHRVMGSRPYYLTLPPRGFLRQSHGAQKTVVNKYAQNISFTHGKPGTANSSGDVHTVVEQSQVTATFHWFPRSRLAKNVQRLRDEAAASH